MAGTDIGVLGLLLKDAFKGSAGLKPLLRELIQQVMQAEAAGHIDAAPHERTEDRKGYRNGTKPRTLATRVGELELDVPQVRGASHTIRACSTSGSAASGRCWWRAGRCISRGSARGTFARCWRRCAKERSRR
jgi:hypothetical protein